MALLSTSAPNSDSVASSWLLDTTIPGCRASLSRMAILERLARHPGIVVSRSQLEDTLFEFGSEVESNAIEVYVSRLRKKIGHELIQTSRGMGYRLEAS